MCKENRADGLERSKIVSLDKIVNTSIEEVKRYLRDRALNPVVPPEHIVTGNCSWELLSLYLTQHPIV